ncbi:filamentation protein [Purpureocillium lavendulum]|uniref:Filamentation protein n=1 Tax=Purpureocillium lavendulum TaxID=1247861 RepID=A0AB34G7B7_9HYPO|nr:filamentation protein [Purpureocillium lavendulum]
MTTKAHHYIDQLEAARCDGNWDAVPELVRKVRKHAPERKCLTLAAETECAISFATTAGSRTSASATARDLDVSTKVPTLQGAIDEERVCVGWLHWVVGEYSLAVERLPTRLQDDGTSLDPAALSHEWTHVCALKSAYLRANCLMREGQRAEALEALRVVAPALNRALTGQVRKQLRYWSELFLTEYCMLSSGAVDRDEASLEDPATLVPFRSWARYWHSMQAPGTGGYGFKGSVPRRQIWSEYYTALSRILENDLPYQPGHLEGLPVSADSSPRSQLRSELKYVETTFRSLLLSETSFPRADEERSEVEAFVRRAVQNWTILCGRGWRDEDLGQGGRSGISRGLLETLYSAATRTYHSTAILRSLFLVHTSLAEFDLALKAFDSYLEIVKKGKARVEKTGEAEPSLDDDGTVLETMALAVMALCRYGHYKAGEKARQLGAELEDWLSKLPQSKLPANENGTPSIAEEATNGDVQPWVAPHIVALAWQAIGLSHAHWSRLTHEAGSRTEIQSKAIRCLRKSLGAEYGRSKDIRSFFSLAVLLAERRELTAAIELTKTALMTNKGREEGYDLLCGAYWQERTLVPLWHLLALLLSARQDYTSALRACEGALEQFKDSSVLFGKTSAGFRSEHLNDAGGDSIASENPHGLVDEMDDSEKLSILEIKMTELALTELTDGPDAAVNASYELLTLFSRLYGSITVSSTTLAAPAHPPKTSGTFRSIRGSIFGSKTDRSRPPTRQPSASTLSEKSNGAIPRPMTTQTQSTVRPMVHVTEENGVHVAAPRSRRATSSHRQRSESGRRNSLKKRERGDSRPRTDTTGSFSPQATIVDGDAFFTPGVEPEQGDLSFSTKSSQTRMSSFAKAKTTSPLNSYLSSTSKSTDFTEISVDVTHSTPHLLPLVQFPKDKERSQRIAILVGIWLTIAGFYRRADLLEDCKGAISEAQKLVHALETESSKDQSLANRSKTASWGERKSVDDLWGDVWSELGLLSLAQNEPYTARSDFEYALTHCPDHSAATVGLSNILLDTYSEKLLPTPAVPPLENTEPSLDSLAHALPDIAGNGAVASLPSVPLGLGSTATQPQVKFANGNATPSPDRDDQLPAPYKATRLPLIDRLAARDRAFALLSGLTRLGTGWDCSEAWFALARAHEESGQPDKAKEVLWWCVELEEAMGCRAPSKQEGARYMSPNEKSGLPKRSSSGAYSTADLLPSWLKPSGRDSLISGSESGETWGSSWGWGSGSGSGSGMASDGCHSMSSPMVTKRSTKPSSTMGGPPPGLLSAEASSPKRGPPRPRGASLKAPSPKKGLTSPKRGRSSGLLSPGLPSSPNRSSSAPMPVSAM